MNPLNCPYSNSIIKIMTNDKTDRIKQRILFDDNLDNVSCLCANWEEFVIEISEWGIYKLGGVDFDTLTTSDIQRLDLFMLSQNGYIKE